MSEFLNDDEETTYLEEVKAVEHGLKIVNYVKALRFYGNRFKAIDRSAFAQNLSGKLYKISSNLESEIRDAASEHNKITILNALFKK